MSDDEKVTRSPVYHVFELQRVVQPHPAAKTGDGDVTVMAWGLAWVEIGWDVPGATDRKAIESVIGTHEHPVRGFDADRRLLPHVAVLTRHWNPRERTRTVNEPTPEERAELEARLAGTVTEEWAS